MAAALSLMHRDETPRGECSILGLSVHASADTGFCGFDAVGWTRASWPAASRLGVRATWFEVRVADTYKD
jgi:hypothetical protein